MKTFVSYSSSPGTQGKYFYNKFFSHYKLDNIYIPKTATIDTIEIELDSAKKLYQGISISMPFKEVIIQYLDYVDPDVKKYQSCNTIVNKKGKLYGYNTDIKGVEFACEFIKPFYSVAILGNGCMGRMFYQYLLHNKYVSANIFSRSLGNWEQRHNDFDVIINCTALGTVVDTSPLEKVSKRVKVVIDLSVKTNKLTMQSKNIMYISGQEFYKRQFIQQFKYYTKLDVDTKIYDKFLLDK